MSIYEEAYLKWFDRHGHARPSHDKHVTEEEIKANMKRLQTSNWRQEGNHLYCQTEMGEMRQTIPVNYLLMGTDDAGMPILKEIDLSS